MYLSDYTNDAQKEGFCLLHSGVGGKTIIGINGKKVVSLDPSTALRMTDSLIGYFAYPNPTLKNDIPAERFYGYDSLSVFRYTPRSLDCARDDRRAEGFKTSGRLEQSVTKPQYIKTIKRIKELLAAGEIYQLCYSIRFRKKFEGDPYALFLKLAEVNPSEFSAFLNCGNYQIISSSPERLFKVQDGQIVTQPIKGTVPKSGGKKALDYLMSSEKERAELDMITDLERNDVGKICEYGTLRLSKERALMELPNIWHTYSEVRGKLRSDLGPRDVVKAMFPGGSITGCPKKRAMEYIEQLEGLPRNIFTGSIGYIFDGGAACGVGPTVEPMVESTIGSTMAPQWLHNWKMDFNIAIRTALVKDDYIEYWAGGGIVADSDPEKEYEECLLKAERFLGIL